MLEAEIIPNTTSYEILIAHLAKANLEMALAILAEIEKRDLSPSTETAESIILFAAKQGYPRFALDFATSYEAVSVRPLSIATWEYVLTLSTSLVLDILRSLIIKLGSSAASHCWPRQNRLSHHHFFVPAAPFSHPLSWNQISSRIGVIPIELA